MSEKDIERASNEVIIIFHTAELRCVKIKKYKNFSNSKNVCTSNVCTQISSVYSISHSRMKNLAKFRGKSSH